MTVTTGHGDWYTANLGWKGHHLLAAFDWDSVIAAPEAVLGGLAAAVYPATTPGTEASVDETEEFLYAYASARGADFSDTELQAAWAAGLWSRSFEAKKQFVTVGRVRSLSEREWLRTRATSRDSSLTRHGGARPFFNDQG